MSSRQLASRWLAARFALFSSVSIAAALTVFQVAPFSANWVAALLIIWMAAAQLTVAVAFLRQSASVFGKRQDGGLDWPSVLLLWPYLAFLSAMFHLKRAFSSQAGAFVLVAPGVWLGRRPLPGELPEEISAVVDLTAEYRERREVLEGRRYFCLPTLNRYIPGDEEMRGFLTSLSAYSGTMLIHCGAGKGRSAAVAAGILMLRGLATTVDEAESQLKACRPVVHLHPVQSQQISRLCAGVAIEH